MTPAERHALQKRRRQGEGDTALILDAIQALRSAVMELASRPVEVAAPNVQVAPPSVQVTAPEQQVQQVDLGPVLAALEALAVQLATMPAPVVQVPPPPPIEASITSRIDEEDLLKLAKTLAQSSPSGKSDQAPIRVGGSRTREGLHVRDYFREGQALPQETGDGTALEFEFAKDMALVVVRCTGGDARVDPFGQVPDETTGILVPDDEPAYITVLTRTVRVWAPPGAKVNVHGFGYHARP